MHFTYKREASLVLYRGDERISVVSVTEGTPASVDFDFDKIWAMRNLVSDFRASRLHLYHVHPPCLTEASSTDATMLKAYTTAFGYPVMFSVVCFLNGGFDDPQTAESHYQWLNGEMTRVNPCFARREGIPLGIEHLSILKAISYVDIPQPDEETVEQDENIYYE